MSVRNGFVGWYVVFFLTNWLAVVVLSHCLSFVYLFHFYSLCVFLALNLRSLYLFSVLLVLLSVSCLILTVSCVHLICVTTSVAVDLPSSPNTYL